ncbi:MAG: glycosyltransferase family 39 protein [Candidatus Altiarchaeota archaeon]|nr:glycosyltransferase family 39 protein [Candidatus Altiarchaeota archaeon]
MFLGWIFRVRKNAHATKEDIAYILALTMVFIIFFNLFHVRGVRGDGQHYYAVTRSLMVDGDLNFTNEYTYLGSRRMGPTIDPRQTTVTGLPRSPYPLGLSLIWIPFFLAANLWEQSLGAVADGYAQSYYSSVTTATVIFSYSTLLIIYFFLRRILNSKVALASTVTTFICTSLFYYTYHDPSMTHAYSAFFVAAFITYHLRPGRRYCIKDSIILGVLIGLMSLVRWQDLLFCGIMIFDIIPISEKKPKIKFKEFIKYNLLVFFVAAIVFSPQLIFWKIIFGSYITSPFPKSSLNQWILKFQIVGCALAASLGFYWGVKSTRLRRYKKLVYLVVAVVGMYLFVHSTAFKIIFSTRHGLFIWTPITALSMIGFIWMNTKDNNLSTRLITAFAVQVFFISLTVSWDGGWSYGIRMLTNSAIVFATGLSFFIDYIRRRSSWIVIVFILLPFIVWNLLLMVQIADNHMLIDPNVPFSRILEGQYNRAPQMLWKLITQGRQ